MAAFFTKVSAFFLAIITTISSFFGTLFMQVTEYKDLSYGSSAAQKFDLYLPKASYSKCTAIVVYIHGGGWTGGDKDVYNNACKDTAKQDYAAMTMNYRMLGEGANLDDMLADITAAMEVAIAKAAEKGITLQRAAFTGASAGGHLAMMYAFKNQHSSPLEVAFCASQCGPSNFTDLRFFEDSTNTNDFYAVVSGLIDQTVNKTTFNALMPELQAASPVHYITKDSPPTILAQGQKDFLVRYSQATDVYDAFYSVGAQCDLILYPNSDHGLGSDPDCSDRYDKLFKEYELKYFGY